MQIHDRSGDEERRIVIGMVVSRTVTARIAGMWPAPGEPGPFASKWANLVGQWCTVYFRRYGEAPGANIRGMFAAWCGRQQRDKDTLDLVERFLTAMSEEYEAGEELNAEYIIDIAGKHFTQTRAQRLAEVITGAIDSGDLEQAVTAIAGFRAASLGVGGYVDVLQNEEAIRAALETQAGSLITYPGALGEFYGNALAPDSLIAYMAPEKRGKSFVLMDNAWVAMEQRRRCAFFSIGDMSQDQMLRRLAARIARRPLRAGHIEYPTKIQRLGTVDEEAFIEKDTRTWEQPLDWREVVAGADKVMQHRIRSRQSYFRLATHPSGTMNVANIEDKLSQWDAEGWVAEVVVIDYADILAPPRGHAEEQGQIDATWSQLRGLSQKRHNLIITATQADAASYTARTLTPQNFSRDKRKFAHVTGMVGINCTEMEKRNGVLRFNWLALREEDYTVSRCVHLAGCRAIGNIAIRSCW